jgi:hypothetical protein
LASVPGFAVALGRLGSGVNQVGKQMLMNHKLKKSKSQEKVNLFVKGGAYNNVAIIREFEVVLSRPFSL